ncbi:hypothetical protein C8Q80DRAFT_1233155 [Daedaleopsis nitida]|nr:hypothetical protein C8Q80DRAFT_1233155 [Daedaleopsis nitida]
MDNEATPHSISSLTHPTKRADVVQTSTTVHEAWCSEIKGRIHAFDGKYETYLDNLVPCVTPLPRQISSSIVLEENGPGPFASFQPVKGGETRSYPDLVDGLTQLVTRFPKAKKLTFVNSNSLDLNFPYAAFACNHHSSRPDISVSWPGEPLDYKEVKSSQWDKIIMVVEVKSLESDDSFQAHKKGKSNESTIIQVVRNARSLMHTHGLLYCFVVGLYGETVRIARFDHACAVVCKPFNIKKRADILQRFFWQFVNPAAGGPFVGCDPTARRLTDQDKQWVRKCLMKRGDPDADDTVFAENIRHGKRLLVHDEQTGKQLWYIAYKPIDINARLFSRATRVWRTIEDTRVKGKNGHLVADKTKKDEKPKVRILKEYWRQLVRKSEGSFCQLLQSKIPEDQSHGLTRMECGGDLGQMEVRKWEHSLPNGLSRNQRDLRLSLGRYAMPPLPIDDSNTSSDASGALALPSSDANSSVACGAATSSTTEDSTTIIVDTSPTTIESTDTPTVPAMDGPSTSPPNTSTAVPTIPSQTSIPGEASAADVPPSYYLPIPQQQTFSWTYLHGEDYSYRERSHMRFIMAHVGRPITEFKNTYELVRAFYDAIIGHKKAYEEAGILHRDISVGNIMILDDRDKDDSPTGFLLDFDYSSIVEHVVDPKRAKAQADPKNSTPQPTNAGNTDSENADSEKKTPRKKRSQMNALEYAAFFQSMLERSPVEQRACQKERTGTYYFIAVELLEASGLIAVIHEPRHDLESFYWVLLWVVLRHTHHNLGQNLCEKIFSYGDDRTAAENKSRWLSLTADEDRQANGSNCLMTHSRPLTELLEGFRALVRNNLKHKTGLTHSAVLELFETALKEKDWPTNDWVRCTLLDHTKTRGSMMSGMAASRGYDAIVAPRLPSVLNSIPKAKPTRKTIHPPPQPSIPEVPDPEVRRSAPADYHNRQEETPTRPKRRRRDEVENGAEPEASSRPGKLEAGPPVADTSTRRIQSFASKRRKMVSGPASTMTLRYRRPRTPPGPVS